MNMQSPIRSTEDINRLSDAAAALGFEIVDINGFLDLVEAHSNRQRDALKTVGGNVAQMAASNDAVSELIQELSTTSDAALQSVETSVTLVREATGKSKDVAGWVQELGSRTAEVETTLAAVKDNNSQIARISTQVNTLAINAKIEAARAGDAGLGFAVVANAIKDLSLQTATAATQISENISRLNEWITVLGKEAHDIADDASEVLHQSEQTDAALSKMKASIQAEHTQAMRIAENSKKTSEAMSQLKPAMAQMEMLSQETSSGVEKTHARMHQLIDASESIVQSSAALGGESVDAQFIAYAKETAKGISDAFETAVSRHKISMDDLFDENYQIVPYSNPEQVRTRAVDFLQATLPAFQEPALDFDERVVFCAAVNRSGYLPVHNNKFSHPQGDDPVWNTANCRNLRIFNDRVGLKAGRNTEPFLLQVYRRDMGGGSFVVMKDLSAPIFVEGRHWGGLRLAYGY